MQFLSLSLSKKNLLFLSTLSQKGESCWLLAGGSESPASLPFAQGPFSVKLGSPGPHLLTQRLLQAQQVEMLPPRCDNARFHLVTQDQVQCKTCELFIPRTFHLMILDHGGLWVTEAVNRDDCTFRPERAQNVPC